MGLCVGALTSRPPTRGNFVRTLDPHERDPTHAIPQHLRLSLSRTGYHFSGGHGHSCGSQDRGATRRLAWPADASSPSPPRTAPSPAAEADPRARVPLPGALGAGRGEQRPAELTAARPSCDEEPADKPDRGDRRRHRSRSITPRPHATSAASDRDKPSAACGISGSPA